jgi:hypothetical protein
VETILAGYRSLKQRVDIDTEMGRRIDQAVFRCEERPVNASKGVLTFVDQVDLLLLLLEIANSPFGASMPFAGSAAELDYINPGIETAKSVAQLRLELLDATECCRATRFGRVQIDVVLDKSWFGSEEVCEEVGLA